MQTHSHLPEARNRWPLQTCCAWRTPVAGSAARQLPSCGRRRQLAKARARVAGEPMQRLHLKLCASMLGVR